MRRAAPRHTRTTTALAAAVATLLAGGATAACGGTTVEDRTLAADPDAVEGGVIVDESIPSTTEAVIGSTLDLLLEMSNDMSRLGSQVAEGAGDDATLARIEQIWEAIRADIQAERPELVASIDTTVDMARTAVERTRPADADKAFSLLTDLVDNYTGDG